MLCISTPLDLERAKKEVEDIYSVKLQEVQMQLAESGSRANCKLWTGHLFLNPQNACSLCKIEINCKRKFHKESKLLSYSTVGVKMF